MMMPQDIENQKFRKQFNGYNINDVDDFLDKLVSEYEKIYKENEEYKFKVSRLQEELDQYKKMLLIGGKNI